jgi:hypothetical protein
MTLPALTSDGKLGLIDQYYRYLDVVVGFVSANWNSTTPIHTAMTNDRKGFAGFLGNYMISETLGLSGSLYYFRVWVDLINLFRITSMDCLEQNCQMPFQNGAPGGGHLLCCVYRSPPQSVRPVFHPKQFPRLNSISLRLKRCLKAAKLPEDKHFSSLACTSREVDRFYNEEIFVFGKDKIPVSKAACKAYAELNRVCVSQPRCKILC